MLNFGSNDAFTRATRHKASLISPESTRRSRPASLVAATLKDFIYNLQARLQIFGPAGSLEVFNSAAGTSMVRKKPPVHHDRAAARGPPER